jgi:hypothetical protein
MPVLVARCDESPAYVPSRVVNCAVCHAECWLSEKTGDSTVAAAVASGDGRIMCTRCLLESLAGDAP